MELTRRSFIEGVGAVSLASLTGIAAAGVAMADEIEWAGEADIVIVGSGGAGCSAAVTVATESSCSAIVLEAAPEYFAGGNTRVSGACFFCGESAEALFNYQKALNCGYDTDEEVLRAWADGLMENPGWLDDVCGGEVKRMAGSEFTDVVDADKCFYMAERGNLGDGSLWKLIKNAADECGVPFYFDTRAKKLIFAEDGTIMGVACEDGRNFKAFRAVILACGGFEYNREIMNTYAPSGFSEIQGRGTMYNRGDGFYMVNSVRANMKRMNALTGNSFAVKVVDAESRDYNSIFQIPKDAGAHDFIFVGPECDRFMYEERHTLARHGKLLVGGVWSDMSIPGGSWCIFGQKLYEAGNITGASSFAKRSSALTCCKNIDEMIQKGIVVKCDTLEEVAAVTGFDPQKLETCVADYNACVEANFDPRFGRGQALSDKGNDSISTQKDLTVNIAAFDLQALEAPYYVVELIPTILNTQGGPQRTAKSEVVDIDGNIVPRLYACGEFGAPYPYKYNLGGNNADAIQSGRAAARAAVTLDKWA